MFDSKNVRCYYIQRCAKPNAHSYLKNQYIGVTDMRRKGEEDAYNQSAGKKRKNEQ